MNISLSVSHTGERIVEGSRFQLTVRLSDHGIARPLSVVLNALPESVGAATVGTRPLFNQPVVYRPVDTERTITLSAITPGQLTIEATVEGVSETISIMIDPVQMPQAEAVPNEETAIVPAGTPSPTTINDDFRLMVSGMSSAIIHQARDIVMATLGEDSELTPIQIDSLVNGTAIGLTNIVDYAGNKARWDIVKDAIDRRLYAAHPTERFSTIEEYCNKYGMSPAEYSKLSKLFNFVIPWIETYMVHEDGSAWTGLDLWRQAGKAKLGDSAPFFFVAINGPELQDRPWEANEAARLLHLRYVVSASEMGVNPPSAYGNAEDQAVVIQRCNAQIATWGADKIDISRRLMRWLIANVIEEGVGYKEARERLRPRVSADIVAMTASRGVRAGEGQQRVLIVPDTDAVSRALRGAGIVLQDVDVMDVDDALSEAIARIFV